MSLLVAAAAWCACSVWLWRSSARTRLSGDELIERRLLGMWWILAFATLHRFDSSRTALDVTTGSIAVENVIEVLAASSGLAFAVLSIKPRRLTTLSLAMCALTPGIVFALSSLVSMSPIVSVSRSMSILAYGAMAIATALLMNAEQIWSLVQRFSSVFVGTVAALCAVGLLLGTTTQDRATWPGVHPNTAGLLTSLSLLVVVIDRSVRPSKLATIAIAIPLAAMNIGSYSRSATLSMAAVAGLVLLVAPRQSRRTSPGALFLRAGFAGTLAIAYLSTGSNLVTRYLNGRDAFITTSTLNGRTELWSESLRDLDEMGRSMYGVGYSASRVLLVSTRSWAGTAHSGYLQLILDVGYLGTSLVGAALIALLVQSWLSLQREARRTLGAVLLFFGLQAATSDSMVLPGPSAVVIFLLLAVGINHQSSIITDQRHYSLLTQPAINAN